MYKCSKCKKIFKYFKTENGVCPHCSETDIYEIGTCEDCGKTEALEEDDYDSIDGIINNGNKQEEYDKAAKTPNKEHNAEKQPNQPKKSLISRSKIKQNADKIAHTHNEQRNNTKSKEQEL